MSVVRSKRSNSGVEFIHTARELQIYTIQKCAGFPKRYTFYVSEHLAASATRIHEFVKMANSVFPTNQHEAQIRRDYLIRANAELYSLVSQIEVAQELFQIEHEKVKHWMDIVDREINLVKAVMRSDKERYKDLP